MINMTTLDTVIAVVVVILLLSLIVESIQTFTKKLFRLKSRQIEDSLVDLFENVLQKQRSASWISDSPFLRAVFFWTKSPAQKADDSVKRLYDAVRTRFAELGRITQFGSNALESLSKEDLAKVTASVGLENFFPATQEKVKAVCEFVSQARTLLDQIDKVQLEGDAQLKWLQLQQAVSPLINDVAQIFDGKEFNTSILVQHVLELRQLDATTLATLFGAFRTQLAADCAAATDERKKQLSTAVANVDRAVDLLGKATRKIDEAVAPLRARIRAMETWYDTVMHSFDERYSRGMRTASFVIGLTVSIVLNANVLSIYDRLATNDVVRDQVVASAAAVQKRYREQITTEQVAAETATNPTQKQKANENLSSLRAKLEDELQENTSMYDSFGFEPFDYTDFVPGRRMHAITGWILMALLLSLGAPFWHDTLESLFGVKNLLRKKSDTRNSEQESGEGATQSN